MSDKTKELISAIAAENGIILGKDDPLMILPLIIQHLTSNFKSDLEDSFKFFKAELEVTAQESDKASKARAERIINAALQAAQEQIANSSQSDAEVMPDNLRKILRSEISAQLNPAIKKLNTLCYYFLGGSILVFAAAIIALLSIANTGR